MLVNWKINKTILRAISVGAESIGYSPTDVGRFRSCRDGWDEHAQNRHPWACRSVILAFKIYVSRKSGWTTVTEHNRVPTTTVPRECHDMTTLATVPTGHDLLFPGFLPSSTLYSYMLQETAVLPPINLTRVALSRGCCEFCCVNIGGECDADYS